MEGREKFKVKKGKEDNGIREKRNAHRRKKRAKLI